MYKSCEYSMNNSKFVDTFETYQSPATIQELSQRPPTAYMVIDPVLMFSSPASLCTPAGFGGEVSSGIPIPRV